jgi:glycerate kinase
MATALGARFLDEDGAPLPPGGAALARLSRIDLSGFDPRVRSIRLRVACDVTNPLCGPKGASRVYGPQKGATPDDVATLDAALAHLAGIVAAQLGLPADYVDTPGSGAAGGLGFGLLAFCRAKLQRGVGIVADSVGLAGKMRGCDLVVTGEGRIDAQTPNGKTPAGVAAVARQLGVPAIAICGCTGAGWEAVREIGIREVFPVTQGRFDPAHPEDGAYERVFLCARDVAERLFGGEPA